MEEPQKQSILLSGVRILKTELAATGQDLFKAEGFPDT